jgi:1-aminocyclopropane-1-carboxylate deaminase/D-cysteine desulfhydrase-like pyridoxal-dependent ACC family enzyme
LEFLLADALEKGCDSVITCGEIQSNHARTTAVASRELGLQPHLVLKQHGKIVSWSHLLSRNKYQDFAGKMEVLNVV